MTCGIIVQVCIAGMDVSFKAFGIFTFIPYL